MINQTGWCEQRATAVRFDRDGRFAWARNFGRVDGIDFIALAPRFDLDAEDRLVLGGLVAPFPDETLIEPRAHTFETRGADGNRRTRALVQYDFGDGPQLPLEPTWPVRWAADRGVLFTRQLGEGYLSVGGNWFYFRPPWIMRLRSNFTLDPAPLVFGGGYPVEYRAMPGGLVCVWNNGATGAAGEMEANPGSRISRLIDGEFFWTTGHGSAWLRWMAVGDGFVATAGHGWSGPVVDDEVVPVMLVDADSGDLLWGPNQFEFPTPDDAPADDGLALGVAARGQKVAVSWDRAGRALLEIFGEERGGHCRVAMIDAASGTVDWVWTTTRPVGPVAIDSENRVWVSVGGDLVRLVDGEPDLTVTVSRSTCRLERVTSPWIYERPPIEVGPPGVEPSWLVTELAVDSLDGVIAALGSQYWKAPEWI